MNFGIIHNLIGVDLSQTNIELDPMQSLIYWGVFAVCIIAAYLLGSLNSAVIVSRLLHGEDIRNFGSGNAGMTNIMRTYGKKEAGLTLLGDTMKMVLSLLLAGLFFGFYYARGMSLNFQMYLAGIACMIGHIKPVFYKFKGGKGVLCYATMGLMLAPIPFLIVLALFFAIVAMTKYISLGSIVCAGLFPLLLQGYMQVILAGKFDGLIFLTSFAASVILIVCHRSNISRLVNHTENKFSLHKKKNAESAAETDDKK